MFVIFVIVITATAILSIVKGREPDRVEEEEIFATVVDKISAHGRRVDQTDIPRQAIVVVECDGTTGRFNNEDLFDAVEVGYMIPVICRKVYDGVSGRLMEVKLSLAPTDALR